MIVKHNPYSFLTGDSPFLKTKPMEISSGRFETEVLFELHHEGAIGRPHGGIAMGLCALMPGVDMPPLSIRWTSATNLAGLG
ncbi:MAG: hypothetical protein M1511_04445 [Deltaproteobacteria bacterium]|nr:hypothetical protein [Deltaproteobacteria bacterium]